MRMIKTKLGANINIRWAVLTATGLNETDYLLEITDPRMNKQKLDFYVEDADHLRAVYKGIEQKYYGCYSLTLWSKNGDEYVSCIDRIWAFELVPFVTDDDNTDIDLYDKIQVGIKGDKGDDGNVMPVANMKFVTNMGYYSIPIGAPGIIFSCASSYNGYYYGNNGNFAIGDWDI